MTVNDDQTPSPDVSRVGLFGSGDVVVWVELGAVEVAGVDDGRRVVPG